MNLLSEGINSSLDTLYLLKHRDGTEYIVDEIYTADEFEFYTGGFQLKETTDRYIVHLLWYRHATEPEWVDAECRCTGFIEGEILAINALIPIGETPR